MRKAKGHGILICRELTARINSPAVMVGCEFHQETPCGERPRHHTPSIVSRVRGMNGTSSSPDDSPHLHNEVCGGDVFFGQSCPICGRRLRIAVNLLGRRVYCQHCGGGFVAADESLRRGAVSADDTPRPCDHAVDTLLAKAEAVLARSSGGRGVSR